MGDKGTKMMFIGYAKQESEMCVHVGSIDHECLSNA